MIRMVRGYGARTTLIVGIGALVLLTGVAFGLQSPIKSDDPCPQGPTASKTQSKLWFNDGSWWGILFDGSSEEYHIYRYDEAKEAWSDTGTLVDARNASRADALWDGRHLYVVSAGTEAGLEKHSARLLRYTYDPSTERYTIDKGFPVTIAEGGAEAVSIAKDSTGKLWATYAQDTPDGELRRVYVTHTSGASGGEDSNWVEPFVPELRGTTVSTDDISAVVAFGSKIGLMWGSQYDESGEAGYHFAMHEDGAPDDEWRSDNAVMRSTMSNDHMNLKADSEGRVYAVTKTRFDRIKRDPDKPYIVLWVRDQKGDWTKHVFGTVRDSHTRSFALVDEARRELYMFATSPTCRGGKIYYKRTSLDDISFEKGKGTLFMQGENGAKIGDATSTKQNLEDVEGAMVVASSPTEGDYYYNIFQPESGEKLTPHGSRIEKAGW
jgi:hypothetical protein